MNAEPKASKEYRTMLDGFGTESFSHFLVCSPLFAKYGSLVALNSHSVNSTLTMVYVNS